MSSSAIPPSPQARCPPFYKDDKGYVWVQELVDGLVSCVGTVVDQWYVMCFDIFKLYYFTVWQWCSSGTFFLSSNIKAVVGPRCYGPRVGKICIGTGLLPHSTCCFRTPLRSWAICRHVVPASWGRITSMTKGKNLSVSAKCYHHGCSILKSAKLLPANADDKIMAWLYEGVKRYPGRSTGQGDHVRMYWVPRVLQNISQWVNHFFLDALRQSMIHY